MCTQFIMVCHVLSGRGFMQGPVAVAQTHEAVAGKYG